MTFGLVIGLAAFAGWLYLAGLRGLFWMPVVDSPAPPLATWPSITVVMPARNEAAMLPQALGSLLAQDYPGEWSIVLVDDHSDDGTSDVARRLVDGKSISDKLKIIAAPEVPAGWAGKVAAMKAGAEGCQSDYILFTDADIEHPKDSLRRLAARSVTDRIDLNSLMVRLQCETAAEELLIPAFVFFFAMLYPFQKINNPATKVAGAAGGVMLVRRQALHNAGGLVAIKGALIDDCALAATIKEGGGDYSSSGRLRLALAEEVTSLRPYGTASEIMRMVSRTAFTQLRYSYGLLAGTVAGMGLLFLMPLLLLIFGGGGVAGLGMGAWLIMTALYVPMVRFYGLSAIWAFTLPAAAAVYITATVQSAMQQARGQGGQWKGRAQAP